MRAPLPRKQTTATALTVLASLLLGACAATSAAPDAGAADDDGPPSPDGPVSAPDGGPPPDRQSPAAEEGRYLYIEQTDDGTTDLLLEDERGASVSLGHLLDGPPTLLRATWPDHALVATKRPTGGTTLYDVALAGAQAAATQIQYFHEEPPIELFFAPDRNTYGISFFNDEGEGLGMKLYLVAPNGELRAKRLSAPRLWGFTSDSRYFALSYFGAQGALVLLDVAGDLDITVIQGGVHFDRVVPAKDGSLLGVGFSAIPGFTDGELYSIDTGARTATRRTYLTDGGEEVYYAVGGGSGQLFIMAQPRPEKSRYGVDRLLALSPDEEPRRLLSTDAEREETIDAMFISDPAADALWLITQLPDYAAGRMVHSVLHLAADGAKTVVARPEDYGAQKEQRMLAHSAVTCATTLLVSARALEWGPDKPMQTEAPPYRWYELSSDGLLKPRAADRDVRAAARVCSR